MIWQFEHRFGSYEGRADRGFSNLDLANVRQLQESQWRPSPYYWVPEIDVLRRLVSLDEADEKELDELTLDEQIKLLRPRTARWLLGFRDVTNATNERTAIFCVLPRTGVGHKIPLVFLDAASGGIQTACFLANVNALVFDYVARQKIGGMSLSYFILKQLPVLTPSAFKPADVKFTAPRVFELVYNAWDIKAFADDIWNESDEDLRAVIRNQWEENRSTTGGHDWNPPDWAEIAKDGIPLPPCKWDDDRRARLRAQLDAYYALLYGLMRDELRYILDPKDVYGLDFPSETFRVLKEKEEKLYGEYRTRRLVLEAFDKLADSPRFHDEMPKRISALENPGRSSVALGKN
jgi:hypothetical protein